MVLAGVFLHRKAIRSVLLLVHVATDLFTFTRDKSLMVEFKVAATNVVILAMHFGKKLLFR